MIGGNIFTTFLVPTDDGEPLKLKCSSFVIVDDSKKGIIFDTGSPYDNKTLIDELKTRFSLEPEDITYVFNTHIHPDHCGGNHLFKNAKIVMSRLDFEFSNDMAKVSLEGGAKELKKFLEKKSLYHTYTDKDCEDTVIFMKHFWSLEKLGFNNEVLFLEDKPKIPNYIVPIETFGHTFNHYSFYIKGEHNDIYVTGDAISNRLVLNNPERQLNEAHMHPREYIETAKALQNKNGIFIPGHDRPFFTENRRGVKENPFEL